MRATAGLRSLRRDTRLLAEDFISPLFVVEDAGAAGPVPSMPGVERFTLGGVDREVEALVGLGIPAVLLFGVPAAKDSAGSGAARDDSVVAKAIERIKSLTDRLVVITDACLCSYTDHGHCGVVVERRGASGASGRRDPVRHKGAAPQGMGVIDNDATLEILGKTAVAHARAGADMVAPSGMMDGVIGAMRSAMDAAGFTETGLLSYAVKYASSFYGPFRDAADSKPAFGDRRSYQMDPANVREALAEVELDVQEGADAVMVKPALPYLDVIRGVRESFPAAPLAAYQVSGEYSMIKAAAQNGWLDEKLVAMEALTAIKRAGADMIITYFAKSAAKWIEGHGKQ
jgi:porphobilinogen synthase